MSPLELIAEKTPVAVNVLVDLATVKWADKKDFSSTVAGKPSYWLIRDKHCPDNTGSQCFTGNCEFAKKYPGSGQRKPCLEFVVRAEAAKSVAVATDSVVARDE